MSYEDYDDEGWDDPDGYCDGYGYPYDRKGYDPDDAYIQDMNAIYPEPEEHWLRGTSAAESDTEDSEYYDEDEDWPWEEGEEEEFDEGEESEYDEFAEELDY